MYPGLHKQAETLLPEVELELAGQERQTVAVAKSIRRTSPGRVAMESARFPNWNAGVVNDMVDWWLMSPTAVQPTKKVVSSCTSASTCAALELVQKLRKNQKHCSIKIPKTPDLALRRRLVRPSWTIFTTPGAMWNGVKMC